MQLIIPFVITFLDPIKFSAVPWLGETLIMLKFDVKFTHSYLDKILKGINA